MRGMSSEWSDRIAHWIRVLKEDFYEPLGEISWEMFPTMEQLPLEEVMRQPFVLVSSGHTWGKTWEYGWFRGNICLPEKAKGHRIVLDLHPEGESTLFVNGKAFGTYRASWVSEKHHFFVDNVLSRSAKGGETFEILMETYAGHDFPCEKDTAETGPVLSEDFYGSTLPEGKRRTLGPCTYGIFREEAYQLYMDVITLKNLYESLDASSLRAVKVARALKDFTSAVDFEQTREIRLASYQEARRALEPVLKAKNGSTVPKFYAVGNAHIDLAWLWPFEETRRKTARTFAAQLRLIDEYPDYRFIQSQPAAYEMCREHYPELFERIREAVKGGQWIAEGAMWVEPDTNIPGGEALIRQILYGKKYYREMFGVESELLWLPDTFGYSAALPQILKGCGIKYMVTQKIFASYNNEERFPYHYFYWEGMDGTRVCSFLPTSYLYGTDPKTVNDVWRDRVQEEIEGFLLPYGYGDGGGGPARDHIESARRLSDLEGSASVKMAGPVEFFEDMEQGTGGPKDTYVGELYFCAHRGTYTTQARVKKNNRKCELALREMEFFGSLALSKGMSYNYEKAERLWKELLLHQFHDILPGSSIAKVYEETEASVEAVIREAEGETEKALRFLSDGSDAVTVLNTLGFSREELISLPDAFQNGAKNEAGEEIPVEKNGFGVRALITVPSMGSVTLHPASGGEKVRTRFLDEGKGAFVRRSEDGYRMENRKISVCLNAKGEVVSFIRKDSGKEFAAGKMNRLRLYKDVPRHFDAWDLDSNYVEQETEGAFDVRGEVLTEGGVEAVLLFTGRISQSSYKQVIRLSAESEQIEFETEIDWKELHRLLKADFPTAIDTTEGINEIQFGYVKRPAHRSRQYDKDRFEVCNHRYSALCDGLNGIALFNDGKYGISMDEVSLSLTLLRAASSPAMRSDNGVHTFCYAFTAWEGSFHEQEIPNRAYAFNVKMKVQKGRIKQDEGFSTDRKNIVLDTVKLAEDQSGDLIVRLYEANQADTTADIRFGIPFEKAYLCDMLENRREELTAEDGRLRLHFRTFEILTIRLEGVRKNDF